MSGHFYESEMLLQECETDADQETSCKSSERDHPTLEDEDLVYERVLGSKALESTDVALLFNDKHGEATENIECDEV